jgi:predicted MFS family arabinose efflux permease
MFVPLQPRTIGQRVDFRRRNRGPGLDVAQIQRPWDLYTRRQRAAFLTVLFLVASSNYVDRNIIGVLLEPIKTEFGASDTMLGLLSGISFALFYATLGLPVARWADRGDRKLVMTLSLAVWSVMTALCGVAATFWQLAAARIGVGAGEAGAIPPAQSLLADYYQPTQRTRAIGIYMMSGTAGYVVALVLGGWIAQNFGWRAAFLAVGLLGLGLAPLTHFVLKEPRRLAQFSVPPGEHETTSAAVRELLRKPSYRNVLSSIVVYFLMAYGSIAFIVSFIIRIHGLNVAQAGATFGVVAAVGTVIGNVGGGALADRLAARDIAWPARLSGWGMMIAMPFYDLALSAHSVVNMAWLLLLAQILTASSTPATFSSLHLVCGSRRRAMAVAIVFFFANLIGLGLGPVIAGSLSDRLAVTHGAAQGLQYALIIVFTVFFPISGWFMLRAARHLKADAEI